MRLADLIRNGPPREVAPKTATPEPENLATSWPESWAAGWCLVHSWALNEPVLWVRDDQVQIPERLQELPRYTWAEIQRLVQGNIDPQTLRAIHVVKTTLKGRVINSENLQRK